jgi:ADP-heptose:LPS heptosyltransferase
VQLLEPLLAQHERFDFISLQQPAQHIEDKRIAQPVRDGFDLMDTAGIIAQLDLVISCDSAIAHLAAALGKPTWLLSRYDGCWRWFYDDRTDSPWYPSLRLYRQPKAGDWASVIERVVGDLEGLSRGPT